VNECEIKKAINFKKCDIHSSPFSSLNWRKLLEKTANENFEDSAWKEKFSLGVVFAVIFPFSNISTNNKWALQGGLCFPTGLLISLLGYYNFTDMNAWEKNSKLQETCNWKSEQSIFLRVVCLTFLPNFHNHNKLRKL
jgi:hypothetical protein